MNEKTTAILAKIRKACPELVELRFGCEVRHEDGEILRVVRWNTSNDSLDTVPMDASSPFDEYNFYPKEYTVIGHPVHLEHLLRAIPYVERIRIATDGTLCGVVYGEMGRKLDLTLTVEQNIETNEALRDWLYELIC